MYYYVAPGGDNGNNGSIGSPWAEPDYGANHISAGDICFVREGTYTPTNVKTVSGVYCLVGIDGKNGSSGYKYQLVNYPNEHPVIDCSNISGSGHRAGVYLNNSSYFNIKGIEVINLPQTTTGGDDTNGIFVQNSYNCNVEFSDANHIEGAGIACRTSDLITFLNCDSHDNYDPHTDTFAGDNADGINFEQVSAGGTNTFRGCKCWNNSDDGFDFYGNQSMIIMENCRAWGNGFAEDRVSLGGDGNGFKLGSSSVTSNAHLRTLQNCIAYGNYHWGFDDNAAQCLMHVIACMSHFNGNGQPWVGGYHLNAPVAHYIKNCVSFDDSDIDLEKDGGYDTNIDHNSWDIPAVPDSADFVSVNANQLDDPRNADGSLAIMTYLHPAVGSILLGKGEVIGSTKDADDVDFATPRTIGCFELV